MNPLNDWVEATPAQTARIVEAINAVIVPSHELHHQFFEVTINGIAWKVLICWLSHEAVAVGLAFHPKNVEVS